MGRVDLADALAKRGYPEFSGAVLNPEPFAVFAMDAAGHACLFPFKCPVTGGRYRLLRNQPGARVVIQFTDLATCAMVLSEFIVDVDRVVAAATMLQALQELGYTL